MSPSLTTDHGLSSAGPGLGSDRAPRASAASAQRRVRHGAGLTRNQERGLETCEGVSGKPGDTERPGR